jgi:integrase
VAKALTDAAIQKYAPPTGSAPRRIPDGSMPGLSLLIYPKSPRHPKGVKSFQMRFKGAGKITLGPYDPSGTELEDEPRLEDVGSPQTLASARLLAQKIIRERKRGRNPIADHRARQTRQRAERQTLEANSFAAAVPAYIDDIRKNQRGWKWRARVLGLHYGTDGKPQTIPDGLCQRWGVRPVSTIDAADIETVIAEARRSAIPGIAPRSKTRSEARARDLHKASRGLFKWLRKERLIADNPCRDLDRPEKADERGRFLSDRELRWLLLAADKADAARVTDAPRAFRVLLHLLTHTGCRLREISDMRWEELSVDLSALNLPAARTKNGRAFSVPLPKAARELIASLPKTNGFVLSTTGGRTPISGFSKMKIRLDAVMRAVAKKEDPRAVIESFRLHDIRRSVASGLQRLGIRHEIIERSLNHVSGKFAGIGGLYQRDPMIEDVREALQRWSEHLAGLLAPQAGKVVPMPRKRSGK